MKKVTHLVPIDRVGGVEIAARTVDKSFHKNIYFNIEYIFTESDMHSKYSLFNIFLFKDCVTRIIKDKPDMLVISLWRSCIVGFFVKIFSPRIKLVLFSHSEADVHILDFLFTRILIPLTEQIWADSYISIVNRFKLFSSKLDYKIISYIPRKLDYLNNIALLPNFIYWGRIGAEKNLSRALKIFSLVAKFHKNSHFSIIGADGGDLDKVKEQVKELNIENMTTIYQSKDIVGIINIAKKCSFYLQTSLYEGMAVSVAESMQLGLVPIVTQVGEIANYCNYSNSIIIDSDIEAARDILMILDNYDRYNIMRKNASLEWENCQTYRESFCINSYELLSNVN